MDFMAIIARVQKLILSPATEWDVIAGEDANVQRIYMNYVGPLVIAGALATAIGMSVIGISYGFGSYRLPAGAALGQGILQVILGLAGVYINGLVINALAPQFGGTQDAGQAFKVAAYAPTAAWVASLVMILPQLGIVALLGALYSLYLLFVGLPKLMKPAEDKAMVYTLAVVGVMIVIYILIGTLSAMMVPSVTPMMRVN
jgi:Yip1 domain